jgi:hypothetical protein
MSEPHTAVSSSETLVSIYQTTWHNISEDSHLDNISWLPKFIKSEIWIYSIKSALFLTTIGYMNLIVITVVLQSHYRFCLLTVQITWEVSSMAGTACPLGTSLPWHFLPLRWQLRWRLSYLEPHFFWYVTNKVILEDSLLKNSMWNISNIMKHSKHYIKGKVIPLHAMKAPGLRRGIAPTHS